MKSVQTYTYTCSDMYQDVCIEICTVVSIYHRVIIFKDKKLLRISWIFPEPPKYLLEMFYTLVIIITNHFTRKFIQKNFHLKQIFDDLWNFISLKVSRPTVYFGLDTCQIKLGFVQVNTKSARKMSCDVWLLFHAP